MRKYVGLSRMSQVLWIILAYLQISTQEGVIFIIDDPRNDSETIVSSKRSARIDYVWIWYTSQFIFKVNLNIILFIFFK